MDPDVQQFLSPNVFLRSGRHFNSVLHNKLKSWQTTFKWKLNFRTIFTGNFWALKIQFFRLANIKRTNCAIFSLRARNCFPHFRILNAAAHTKAVLVWIFSQGYGGSPLETEVVAIFRMQRPLFKGLNSIFIFKLPRTRWCHHCMAW